MIFETPAQFINDVVSRSQIYNLLSLDIGDRKIGVAIASSVVPIATPLMIIMRLGLKQDTIKLQALIKEYKIEGLVIGLPLGMDGKDKEQTTKVRKLVEKLAEKIDIPMIFEDERMTTKLANALLQQGGLGRKERVALDDQVSAQIIMESFLKRL